MCQQDKSLSEFSVTPKGRGRRNAYCKSCFKDKYYSRDYQRKQTAKWRKDNRAIHLVQHRLRMFKRKSNIRVVSDGSVTSEFVNSLYSTPICFYCKQTIDLELRTLDHKVALARGGLHSAKNLVMACRTCNSSKRDLSEQEFLEILNK